METQSIYDQIHDPNGQEKDNNKHLALWIVVSAVIRDGKDL